MIWTGCMMMDLVILLLLLLFLVIITVRYTPIGYSAGIQVHGGHNKVCCSEKEWWHMDEVFFFFRRKHKFKFDANLSLNIFLILF